MMSMVETVPACGHMDEVEEFDGHEIEDWNSVCMSYAWTQTAPLTSF